MKIKEFNSFPANSKKKCEFPCATAGFIQIWLNVDLQMVDFVAFLLELSWTFVNFRELSWTFVNFRGGTFSMKCSSKNVRKTCVLTFVEGSLKWNIGKNLKKQPFLKRDRNQEIWQLTSPKMSEMPRNGSEWGKIIDFTWILWKWRWNSSNWLEMIQIASVLLFELSVQEASMTACFFPVRCCASVLWLFTSTNSFVFIFTSFLGRFVLQRFLHNLFGCSGRLLNCFNPAAQILYMTGPMILPIAQGLRGPRWLLVVRTTARTRGGTWDPNGAVDLDDKLPLQLQAHGKGKKAQERYGYGSTGRWISDVTCHKLEPQTKNNASQTSGISRCIYILEACCL